MGEEIDKYQNPITAYRKLIYEPRQAALFQERRDQFGRKLERQLKALERRDGPHPDL